MSKTEPAATAAPGATVIDQTPRSADRRDDDRTGEPPDVDLVSLTARLAPEAFDRLGGAMESAIQQTRSRKTIRVAGQGLNQRSRYDTAVHSFVSELQRELSNLLD